METPKKPEPRRRWAWRLGSLAGISIYVHATFVLLLAWIAMSHLSVGHEFALVGQGLLLVFAVFGCVVLHELGHALVARRFGVATRDITLYPIGGIAALERMPEKPAQELLVAITGPIVNGVIALSIYVGLRLAGVGAGGDPLTIGGSFAIQLMWINLSLGAFNLLPAFPMDGGRILRGLLGFWMSRPRATEVASRVGRALAVVMGIAGLMWSPMLAVIALFVWMAAGQEAAMEHMKTTLHDVSVADAMIAQFQTLPPGTPVGSAAERMATGFQHDFPVVESGRLLGILTRDDVVRGLTERGPSTTVAEVMHRHVAMAGLREELSTVLGRMPPDGSAMLVLDQERLVGLLDPEHVSALLALRAAGPRGLA